jgi:hypothetical protein
MITMSTTPKRGTDHTPHTPSADHPQQAIASLEGSVPTGDRLSLRSMISNLVSRAMGDLSSTANISDAPTKTEFEKKALATTPLSVFSRLLSGIQRGFFLAVDAVVEFARYLAERLSSMTLNDHSVAGKPTTETPRVSHPWTANHVSSQTKEEQKSEAYTPTRAEADKTCGMVAEATRRRDEEKQEKIRHEDVRVARVKEDAEHEIDRIDSANGITNADIAIIKANLEGSYGSVSTAIREIIEAQGRETDPHKKLS